MHGFKSAILEKLKNGQKSGFFFLQKAFFWSIMKMAIRNFFIACARVCQIQDLSRKKYKKGILKKEPCGNWKIIFVLGLYESLERLEG